MILNVLEIGDRAIVLPERHVDVGALHVRGIRRRVQLQGLREVLDRFFRQACLGVRPAARKVELRQIRGQLYGLVQVRQRPFGVFQLPVQQPAAQIGAEIVGLELDGLIEIQQGFIGVVELGLQHPSARQGASVARVHCERLVELVQRALEVSVFFLLGRLGQTFLDDFRLSIST